MAFIIRLMPQRLAAMDQINPAADPVPVSHFGELHALGRIDLGEVIAVQAHQFTRFGPTFFFGGRPDCHATMAMSVATEAPAGRR